MPESQHHSHPVCGNCRFFHSDDRATVGDCHRFPPAFAGNASPTERHHWRHPMVSATDWCGEYLRAVPDPTA